MYLSLVIHMDTILYESESEIAQSCPSVTLWTVAYEAPPLQADSFTIWAMREAHTILYSIILFQTRWLFTFPSIDLHGLLISCLLLT